MAIPKLFVRFVALLIMQLADVAEGLTHGRAAKKGEFPSVVRIRLLSASESSESSRVSTGVLVTTTRVLTTCDSVGFPDDNKVQQYNLSLVLIRGGSVSKSTTVEKVPTSSRVHPRCYFLTSGMVLFNFGFYEFNKPFTDGYNNNKLLRPLKNVFASGKDMGKVLKRMWTEYELGEKPTFKCYCAGWGHPIRIYEGQGEPDNSQAISNTLRVSEMTVVDFHHCRKMSCEHFQECLISIWEYGLVCAQAESGGPCRNDKGAPLICDGQIFAIHTNPQACSEKAIPRHFVRIDLAFDFVFGKSGCFEFRQSTEIVVTAAIFTIIRWLNTGEIH